MCSSLRRLPHAFRIAAILFVAAIPACGEGHAAAMDSAQADSVARVRQDSINRAQPGYVVDSILPVEEQLRRFRAGLDTVHQLTGGSPTAESLVRAFMENLERADTAALVRLTISRAEFAWLVYPDSPLSTTPYRQAPDIVWLRHAAASSSGLGRLLSRIGAQPLELRSWRCDQKADVEGSNRIRGGCSVRFSSGGADPTTLQLFSSIIERQGSFKILSYANAF